MRVITLSLLAGGAAALLAIAPASFAVAQPDEPAAAAPADHGNWTLKQRQEWLDSRLDKARDDGSLDHHEYERVKHELHHIHQDEDRMRDHHDAHQLTDNETAELETRLDAVAAQIHWLHENSFQRPW